MNELKKGLYILSTPIGNLDDISLRAVDILKRSDFIICENPKHSIKLLNKLGIKKKLFSLHDYNEIKLIKRINKYQENSVIALISDSGAPLISDPGYKLVKDYIDKKIYITSIPGPTSLISSLQLSGMPINNFIFYGFAPKSNALIEKFCKKIIENKTTSIVFISGSRLEKFIKNLFKISVFLNIAVCKELTKKNEIVIRGSIEEIINIINNDEINLKGEFTIIISSGDGELKKTIDESAINQISILLKKFSLTETVEIVHKLSSISKNEIYRMALNLKND